MSTYIVWLNDKGKGHCWKVAYGIRKLADWIKQAKASFIIRAANRVEAFQKAKRIYNSWSPA